MCKKYKDKPGALENRYDLKSVRDKIKMKGL